MTPFEYLSVLLSIILGLGITHVLQGYRGLLLARRSVRLYWPTLIWSVLILLFTCQAWWASFGLEEQREWRFDVFLVILLQMALIYMGPLWCCPTCRTAPGSTCKVTSKHSAGPFSHACFLSSW
jgi:hypothetical protein